MNKESSKRTLRELWRVFDLGDHLTDSELKRLIKSAEKGVEYLQARGERLATFKTIMDLNSLRGYLDARRRSP